MKVLLIHPPKENMITTNLPSMVDKATGTYPPLGLMYVAAYAEKNSDHKISILDTQAEKIGYNEIGEEIKKRKPDVVGIQSMTFTHIDTILTAKIVKSIDRDIKIVLGGPHVNIYPNETINIPEVDYIVLGEGEITFTELINNLEEGSSLKTIRGIVFKDYGKVVITEPKELINDLDSIPFPARHLTPYKKYYSLLTKHSPVTTMMTSRGCPYKCLFCDRPHLGKRFRARSAKNVVNEMEECVNMGIREIFIYDDTFTVNRQRVIDICREISMRDFEISWDIRTRVDAVDKELINIMKKAGCERIHYGIEAGTPEILKVLRKGITIEQAQEAFKATKDVGIENLAYFIIGSPTETKEQILQTLEFAKKINPDFAHFSVMTPFPATDLYRLGLAEHILKNDYWSEFAKNPTIEFKPELWEEVLSREELVELLKHSYKSFYSRPSYIMKSIVKVRSYEEFKRKVKAGIGVLKL